MQDSYKYPNMHINNKIKNLLFQRNTPKPYSFKQMLELGKSTKLPLKIEQQKGALQRWSATKICPFDYGEFPNYINPADHMGWDIILAPSSNVNDNLLVSGVVRISDIAPQIEKPHGNILGNHKLILSKDGKLSEDDKKLINDYFKDNPAFKTPDYFDNKPIHDVLNEDWETSTLGRMKLGNFHDKDTKGIVVGPTARKMYGAPKFKNKMLRTNPGESF